MPWEKTYNQDVVVDRAMKAFWAKGYSGTSVSDLVSATGLNRGSLYSAFKDKRGLFIETLKAYDRMRQKKREQSKAGKDPRSQILDMFRSAVTTPEGMPPGCLMVNAGLELGPHDKEVCNIVSNAMSEAERYIRDRIIAAQNEGSIPVTLNPETTAKSLFALFVGLRVMTRSGVPIETRRVVLDQVEQLIA